jgi:replicative DNA helicase
MHLTVPHSVEAEQGVLGSMLLSPRQVIPECIDKINPAHFHVPAHRTIYSVLVGLWNACQAIDLITVTQTLRDRHLLESVGGAGFITSLLTFVPTAANVQYYIDIVREKRALREVQAAARDCLKRINQPMLDVPGTLSFAATRFAAIEHYSKNGSLDSVAEKNWGDALNESVVTALELHDLELAPRGQTFGRLVLRG